MRRVINFALLTLSAAALGASPGGFPARPARAYPAPTTDVYFPLDVVDQTAWNAPREEIPLLTVGKITGNSPFNRTSLGSGEQWLSVARPPTGKIDRTFISGGGMLEPDTISSVNILLAAPLLNIKQTWLPESFSRKDDHFTLHVRSWDSLNADSGKNFDHRLAYLFNVPRLPAGTYDLSITCDHVAADADGLYTPTGVTESATTKLKVADNAGGGITTIPVNALAKTTADVKAGVKLAPPLHWARSIYSTDMNATAYRVAVGAFDAQKFMDSLPQRPTDPPKPQVLKENQSATANELCAAILSPRLNSGEYMTLGDITFLGTECTIHTNLWRDNGGRGGNVPSQTFLLVPLAFLKSGDHKVTVKWHDYHAQTMLTPYEMQAAPPAPDTTVTLRVK